MADVRLECEWEHCECTFESDNFQCFRSHIEDHLREILPGYRRQGCNDTMPSDFTCPWKDCCWEFPGNTQEFIRHVLFHAFHSKVKVVGHKKQLELNLPTCSLDCPSRNVIPDIPDPYICMWESCVNSEYNCPQTFYQHVEGHAMGTDVEVAGQGSKLVACQWIGCSFLSKTRYKLKEHCRSHSQEKVYGCHVCGGMFASRTKFLDHLNRQNKSGFPTFQCSHCLRYCGSQRILRDHMRHHVNSVKCNLCDMTCPNPSGLKQHMKFRHSEERPYKCDYCEYSCKTPSDLRRHRESHNAVFAYECSVEGCSFTARATQTLKRHYIVCHQGKDISQYECHMCGQRYTRGAGLTHHLKTKHNFRWPAGHPRFRYKEFEDGIYRLQTVRFESMQLSQQMADGDETQQSNTAEDDTSVDGGELNASEKESNIPQGNEYQQLLQQYEQHESQLAQDEADDECRESGGPMRRAHSAVRMYPYQRPQSPYQRPQSPDSLDLSQTLLALQHATVHLPGGQETVMLS